MGWRRKDKGIWEHLFTSETARVTILYSWNANFIELKLNLVGYQWDVEILNPIRKENIYNEHGRPEDSLKGEHIYAYSKESPFRSLHDNNNLKQYYLGR